MAAVEDGAVDGVKVIAELAATTTRTGCGGELEMASTEDCAPQPQSGQAETTFVLVACNPSPQPLPVCNPSLPVTSRSSRNRKK